MRAIFAQANNRSQLVLYKITLLLPALAFPLILAGAPTGKRARKQR